MFDTTAEYCFFIYSGKQRLTRALEGHNKVLCFVSVFMRFMYAHGTVATSKDHAVMPTAVHICRLIRFSCAHIPACSTYFAAFLAMIGTNRLLSCILFVSSSQLTEIPGCRMKSIVQGISK